MSVLIVTSVGDIVVDLHADRCPLTAKNFLKLCKMKYYNGCLFHKVEKDFMAQTGDRTGTGTAGDSLYKFLFGEQARFFEDEIHPDLKHSKKGTVAMASAGENCNASQFYFTLRDDIDYLDGKHTVFGIVEEKEGLDTLEKINETFVDDKGRPFKNIRIKHTYILDDPFDDPPQLAEFIPENSPEGKPHDEIAEERLEDNWAPMDTTLNPHEYIEVIHAKEAHTNAAILESIGDIPDADIKPPENVLFVCKLNPVTQDEDLHTIFSRFGTVSAADIIRDFKTGDSLCYAFIEFENREACEMAYFKMDNTLIDDRRIHVDFSQSVSKLWKKFRHGTRTHTNTGGCFKCGAEDHIAKDCDPAANNKERGPRYVLKQENIQHGNDDRMYDMMFDEENLENMEHQGKTKKRKMDSEKSEHSKHKDYDKKDSEKSEHSKHTDYDRKDSEKSEHSRHKNYDRKDSDHRRYDRTEGNKEDRNRDGKRDESYLNEERHAGRYKDREHRNRHDNRDHRNRYEDREHQKRHERSRSRHDDDDDGDQRDSRKRNGDSDRGRKYDGNYRGRERDSPHRERRHK